MPCNEYTSHILSKYVLRMNETMATIDFRCQNCIQIKIHSFKHDVVRSEHSSNASVRQKQANQHRNINQIFSTWFSGGHCRHRRHRIPVAASVFGSKDRVMATNECMHVCRHDARSRMHKKKTNEWYWKWNETHHYRALVAVTRFIITMIDHCV